MNCLNHTYTNKEISGLVVDVQVKAALSTLQLRKPEGMPVDAMTYMNMTMGAIRIPCTTCYTSTTPGGYYTWMANSETNQTIKIGFSSEDYKTCVAYNPLVGTEEVEITEGEFIDLVNNENVVEVEPDLYAPVSSDVDGELDWMYIRNHNNGEHYVMAELEARL